MIKTNEKETLILTQTVIQPEPEADTMNQRVKHTDRQKQEDGSQHSYINALEYIFIYVYTNDTQSTSVLVLYTSTGEIAQRHPSQSIHVKGN